MVDEALAAFGTGNVTAMHDPTEGGVANGIHELADASRRGFRIFEERISIADETREICGYFRIDPLCLIASGSLLIAARAGSAHKVVAALAKRRIPAAVIGDVLSLPRQRLVVRKNGREEALPRPVSDDLWRALRR